MAQRRCSAHNLDRVLMNSPSEEESVDRLWSVITRLWLLQCFHMESDGC